MLNPRESVKFPLANLHPPASAALKTNSRRVRNQGSLKLRSMKILSWQLAERVCSTITCNPRNRKAFVLLCRMGCSIKITDRRRYSSSSQNCERTPKICCSRQLTLEDGGYSILTGCTRITDGIPPLGSHAAWNGHGYRPRDTWYE